MVVHGIDKEKLCIHALELKRARQPFFLWDYHQSNKTDGLSPQHQSLLNSYLLSEGVRTFTFQSRQLSEAGFRPSTCSLDILPSTFFQNLFLPCSRESGQSSQTGTFPKTLKTAVNKRLINLDASAADTWRPVTTFLFSGNIFKKGVLYNFMIYDTKQLPPVKPQQWDRIY